jgi:hypothetical protein
MPNDAKLGLIAGVAVVMLIAAMFFRKDGAPLQAAAEPGVVKAPLLPEPKLPPLPTKTDSDLPPLPPPPVLPDVGEP